MALGDSAVSICNIGLVAMGEDPIVSFTDISKAATLCGQVYDQERRAMLRAHPWNCAKRQANLAAAVGAPLFTYANAFPVPADFLRMYDLPENDEAIWEVMNLAGIGMCIATDEGAPLQAVYIFDLTDPTLMDPLLVQSIGFQIAQTIAIPIGKDKEMKKLMAAEREGRLDIARLAGSQENSPKEWDEDILLRRRL